MEKSLALTLEFYLTLRPSGTKKKFLKKVKEKTLCYLEGLEKVDEIKPKLGITAKEARLVGEYNLFGT